MGIEVSKASVGKYSLLRRVLCSQNREPLTKEDLLITGRTWKQISLATLPAYLESKARMSSSISFLLSIADAAGDVEDCRKWFFDRFLEARRQLSEVEDSISSISSLEFYGVMDEILGTLNRCTREKIYERLTNLAVGYSCGGLLKSTQYLPFAEGILLALSRCLAGSWTDQVQSAWARLMATVLRIVVPAAASAEKRLTLFTEANSTQFRIAGETGSHHLEIGGYFRPIGSTGSIVQGRHVSISRVLPVSNPNSSAATSTTPFTIVGTTGAAAEHATPPPPVIASSPHIIPSDAATSPTCVLGVVVPPSIQQQSATNEINENVAPIVPSPVKEQPALAIVPVLPPVKEEPLHDIVPVPSPVKEERTVPVLSPVKVPSPAKAQLYDVNVVDVDIFRKEEEDFRMKQERKRGYSSSFIDIRLSTGTTATAAACLKAALEDTDHYRGKSKMARRGTIFSLVFLDCDHNNAVMWQRCVL